MFDVLWRRIVIFYITNSFLKCETISQLILLRRYQCFSSKSWRGGENGGLVGEEVSSFRFDIGHQVQMPLLLWNRQWINWEKKWEELLNHRLGGACLYFALSCKKRDESSSRVGYLNIRGRNMVSLSRNNPVEVCLTHPFLFAALPRNIWSGICRYPIPWFD